VSLWTVTWCRLHPEHHRSYDDDKLREDGKGTADCEHVVVVVALPHVHDEIGQRDGGTRVGKRRWTQVKENCITL